MIERLRDGSWLTADRIRAVALVSLALTVLSLLYLLATAHGTLDAWGRPLGTDFSNVWTAGQMALEGRAPEAWDWAAHYQVQQAAHGDPAVPFYGWHYPPPFLLLAGVLALLPYLAALAVWQAASLWAAAKTFRAILHGRPALLVALGAPVVLVCLTHGHNGFLTAALLGGGLLLLDRKPLLAGLLFGCLVYKPQFALVVPLLLLAGGHVRAIAGAFLSAAFLIGATLAIWGWPVWQAFLDSLPLTRQIVIEQGETGWHKIQSLFAMVRMWGGSVPLAYTLQGAATLAAMGATFWLARTARPNLRNAAACAAAMLSTPYVLDYDLVVLGLGAAFLVADGMERGFRPWEKSLLALVWIAPLVSRTLAGAALVPLGQIAIVTVLALALRRALALDGGGLLPRASPSRH
ncbi:MAG TPA: glycosyltransferase family 87 protein [Allosphingosinicella sp.]|nr:glycosyltransferase family 87 protein [Allosphingosinicella sp.]